MRARFYMAAAAALAAMAVPVAAQDAGSRATREFVQAAGHSDQFEILEAQTVLTQATDPQVRAFAQQMIRDHDQLGRTLTEATTRAGLQPPPKALDGDQAKMLGELQGLRGPQFDQAYARHQALAHRAALVTEQRYAANGDAPPVRQAAAAATPLIAAHRDMAERLQARLGGS